ncbi:MAG: hypothetical protein ACRDAM_02095, partial [Casimicrobium sp.]
MACVPFFRLKTHTANSVTKRFDLLGQGQTTLTDIDIPVADSTIEMLKLDEAMNRLEEFDPE